MGLAARCVERTAADCHSVPVAKSPPHTEHHTQASMRLEEMDDEPLASYREAVRRRLQELMLRDHYHPGHPLVVATRLHLDMSSASEAAQRHSAPSLAHFYQGCDLFYANCTRSATPPSPGQELSSPSATKVTI